MFPHNEKGPTNTKKRNNTKMLSKFSAKKVPTISAHIKTRTKFHRSHKLIPKCHTKTKNKWVKTPSTASLKLSRHRWRTRERQDFRLRAQETIRTIINLFKRPPRSPQETPKKKSGSKTRSDGFRRGTRMFEVGSDTKM